MYDTKSNPSTDSERVMEMCQTSVNTLSDKMFLQYTPEG